MLRYNPFCCFYSSFIFLILYQGHFVSLQWLNPITDPPPGTGTYHYCSESQTFYESYGEFDLQSKLENYRDFCVLIAPKDISLITVYFVNFEFGNRQANGNCTDFLEISSMEGYSSLPPKRYCGTEKPPSFTSGTGYVWIRVHRESYFRMSERIVLRYTSELKCIFDKEIDQYTFISLPSYQYRIGDGCDWTISLKDQSPFEGKPQVLQVQITDWALEKMGIFGFGIYGTSGFSRLRIYDGRGGHLLASFNTSSNPLDVTRKVVMTTGPEVRILFDTSRIEYSSEFNITVKVKGYCIPGTLPCGDGVNCYSTSQICDGHLQCSSGYDEMGCAACPPMQFWCGTEDTEQCYTMSERCNGFSDCHGGGQDESNCESCSPGSFLCKSRSKCIYERWTCDGDYDCADGSDEEGCDYAASRRVITAAVIGSLVCSLLLVIAIGCTCKLYSLRASHHRHPHHHYRATPLTRVERELFARQAPPTYDMTINGVSTENTSSRSQRSRRRRSRRYQFQRAAPANVGHQSNLDNRQDSAQSANSGSGPSSNTRAPDSAPHSTPTTQQQQSNPEDQNTPTTDIAQQLGAFLFESIRSESSNTTEGTSAPPRTSTPLTAAIRDSCTQTSSGSRDDPQNPPSSSSSSRRSSSNARRSNRSSTRSRSSRGSSSSSNAKDQQAKPLPKKKRILPVMVPAPCADVVVEEDMLACVYPCPPSYSQAVMSGSPEGLTEPVPLTVEDLEESASSVENQEEDSEIQQEVQTSVEETLEDDSLTTVTKSRFFLFSIGRAIKNIASTSFPIFRKNPYLQMSTQDSRRNSAQSQNNSGISLPASSQPRTSTSSDEDLLDCAMENRALRCDSADDFLPLNSAASATVTETPTTSSATGKVFPQRRNLGFFSKRDTTWDDTNSLDMSDFTTPDVSPDRQ